MSTSRGKFNVKSRLVQLLVRTDKRVYPERRCTQGFALGRTNVSRDAGVCVCARNPVGQGQKLVGPRTGRPYCHCGLLLCRRDSSWSFCCASATTEEGEVMPDDRGRTFLTERRRERRSCLWNDKRTPLHGIVPPIVSMPRIVSVFSSTANASFVSFFSNRLTATYTLFGSIGNRITLQICIESFSQVYSLYTSIYTSTYILYSCNGNSNRPENLHRLWSFRSILFR